MVSSAAAPASSSAWLNWQLLFATQPDPDLEFTEDDLGETPPAPAPPEPEPKPSGKRPLLWILLFLLVGGIGYVAMDPDGAMHLLEPYLGSSAPPPQPVAHTPPPKAPAPTPPPAPAPAAQTQAAASAPSSGVDTPTPPQAVTPPAPALPSSAAPPTLTPVAPPPAATTTPVAPASSKPVVKPTAPITHIAGPRFSEGQRVLVAADTSRPKALIPLFYDSIGSKTSVTVQPNTTVTVLDGEYHKKGWIYAVRTQDGRKGWLPERSLKPKR
ncbi:hypothetical protein FBQ96_06205 [Nitrospirales bacterium NOB]|nr:hypothetical protein [Nitrospira sp. NTP2]MDL1889162.1 hypothetical protein [Nitrospirales bacterium NOB]QOJ36537.1 MAG: SH3 domain-containing protein [Nitrospira sp.]RIK60330.1 MAG: hypothetical protein DCC63_04465 [Nitrospira sp.]